MLAQVRHPNVVTIHGAERIGDQVGLWMELVEGRTLEQILEQGRRFTVTEAVEIGIQLCGAIAAVHDAGLLHRDIKSHNVMLADDGRVVLMDFGTGRELGDNSAAGLAGTPLYLAPELLSGQEPTVRSDIYSLGVLLYHLLTGSYPVRAQSLRDLRLAHERHERTDVRTVRPDVAPKLARIIERAIDPAPERRYQSVDALLPDLAALKPPSRVVRLPYASGVAAAILLVIAIGWEVGGRQVGWSTTPIALLAGVAGLNPASVASVNPTGQPVIAVLPFENLSAEPDSDYLVDGLTDEIIRNLASRSGPARSARERRRLHSRANRATCARLASSSERIWSSRGPSCGPATGCASTPNWFRSRGMFLCGPNSSIASSTTSSPSRMKSRGRSSTSFD